MRKELDKILKKYIKKFEKKQDLTFEFAVNDDLMDVMSFGCVNFFSMRDIIYDIDNNIEKGKIIDWLEHCLDYEQYINTKLI